MTLKAFSQQQGPLLSVATDHSCSTGSGTAGVGGCPQPQCYGHAQSLCFTYKTNTTQQGIIPVKHTLSQQPYKMEHGQVTNRHKDIHSSHVVNLASCLMKLHQQEAALSSAVLQAPAT